MTTLTALLMLAMDLHLVMGMDLLMTGRSDPKDVMMYPTRGRADVNERDAAGRTALMRASELGNIAFVNALLRHNTELDVNIKDNDGWSALIIAAFQGHANIIHALLTRHDLEVNDNVYIGYDAMVMSSLESTTIRSLLYGTTSTDDQVAYRMNALLTAVFMGHTEAVMALLSSDRINVNWTNQAGLSAIIVASSFGRTQILLSLLSRVHWNCINAVDSSGFSALYWAVRRGHLMTVLALISRPDLIVDDAGGSAALMFAVDTGNTAMVSALMMRPDLQVNQKDAEGWTALTKALSNGDVATVSVLVADQRVNVNERIRKGSVEYPALVWAVAMGHTEAVKVLMTRADLLINEQMSDGSTAVVIAERLSSMEMVTALLGIDIDELS